MNCNSSVWVRTFGSAFGASKRLIWLMLACVLLVLSSININAAQLRRPIGPNQPMWLIHIDTWNYPDPEKIIELIPEDIRPYVVFNISLSIGYDADGWSKVDSGYETAKSWLRTCAENQVWAMIQPSSGGYTHFSDYDLTVFEDFFREYPNFLGFNYCEQFWGFDDLPLAPPWTDRISLWSELLPLSAKYGGYLTVSWCGNQWNPSLNPIAMLKLNPAFSAACEQYTENFILCEKYTQISYQSDMESLCLGAYLSGYSGNYGIRYDSSGWSDPSGTNVNFTMATAGAPQLEHMMLTGQTVVDGPELIWNECFYGGSPVVQPDGYSARTWYRYSQFDNMSIDLFRKVLDGTVRIPTRQEVIDRTKVVVVNDVSEGTIDEIYSSPDTLFEGLYRMDGDGNLRDNKSFFKKTGRYPTVPVVYNLADAPAQSFQIQVNKSEYDSVWGWNTIATKTNYFNSLFPSEYTGDIFAGRHENGWVVYNRHKTTNVNGPAATGNIPFKYNTCDSMDLSLAQYTSGVIKETATSLTFYLNNYDNEVGLGMRTDTITIYGSTSQPTYSYTDRASHAASSLSSSWVGGVFTLTVTHNGPLDITIDCEGTATGRLTAYPPASTVVPTAPMVYMGPRQCEGEVFDYKNIEANRTNGDYLSPPPVTGYTGQGYLQFGTSSAAAVRDTVTVPKAGTYCLDTRYSNANGSVNTIDLYVNGVKVADPTFIQTGSYSDWSINTQYISLNAGENTIEFLAGAAASSSVYFDNLVVVPTTYGDELVIEENDAGYIDVEGAIGSSSAGYLGIGYADSADASGAGIFWALNFDTSVSKSLTFRYAATSDLVANLIVNGTNVATNVQFPSTGSLINWDYATVYPTVPAGQAIVRLEAVSGAGLPNIDSLEVYGATPWTWTPGTVAFVPLGLSATPVASSQIDLDWANSPGADSYNVKRASTSGGPLTTIATSVTGSSYSDTGLSELTTHYYVVSAVNATGESADSTEAGATTLTVNPPAAPTGLGAVATSYDQIDLSWNPVPGADSYIVKRSLSSGGPYVTIAMGVAGTAFSDAALFADTSYYYVVSALNSLGESSDSVQATATTLTSGTIEAIADVYVRDGSYADGNFGTAGILGVKSDATPDSGSSRITYLKFDVSGLADAQSVQLKWTPNQVDDSNLTLAYELVTDDSWTETGLTWNNQPSGSWSTIASVSGYTVGQQKAITVTGAAIGEGAGDGVLSIKVSNPVASYKYMGFNPREVATGSLRPVLESTFAHVGYPVPAAPADLGATMASESQVNLSWTASAGASSYNVKRATNSGGPYTLIAAGISGSSFSDYGLYSGTTYYYVVSAINGTGESTDSSEASATPVAQAVLENHSSGQFAISGGSGSVGGFDLADNANVLVVGVYTDNSNCDYSGSTTFAGVAPDGFINASGGTGNRMGLFYWLNPNTAAGQTLVVANAAANPAAYVAMELSGVDTAAAVASTGPTAVSASSTSISTTAGNTFITCYYSVNAGSSLMSPDSPLTQLGSEQQVSAGGGGIGAASMVRATAGAQSLSWTSSSSSSSSNQGIAAFAFTPSASQPSAPVAPTGLGATAVPTSQIDLSWTASIGATSYNVKRASISGGPYTTIATGVTGTSYSDAGLSEGTAYYYVVSAVNAGGESADSAEVGDTTLVNPPVAPTGLGATAVSTSQIDLSWTASIGATSYNVKRASGSGGPYTMVASNVVTTSYSDAGLSEGTAYYYVVSAVNAGGESTDSSEASATTQSTPVNPPTAPTGLEATAASIAQIDLSWMASSGATGYNVKWASTSGGPYETVASNVVATSHSDVGVFAGTTNYYVVSAVNTGGESSDSAEASAVTPELVAYLPFDENSGTTAADASPNGFDGTLVNGPLWATGLDTNSVLLDGLDDYVSLPTGVVGFVGDFTIATWVYLNSISTWERVFDFGNDANNCLYLTVRDSSGVTRLGFKLSGQSQIVSGTAPLPTNAWVHVAVTLNGGTCILYVDGVAVGTNSNMTINPAALGDTVQNYIGKSASTDPYFDGAVDDFRIIGRALSAAEIVVLATPPADATAPSAPTGLSATAGDASVSLDWADNAEPDLESYSVYRSTTSGSGYSVIASDLASSAYVDNTVVNDTTYYYVVTATDNAANESANSAEASATPQAAGSGGVVFSDSFENGQWNGLWSEGGQNDWFTSTQRSTEGSFSAEVDGNANDVLLTSIMIDLGGLSNATITFDWYIESSLDSGEYVAFDVSTDGGSNWSQLTILQGNVDTENVWHNESIDVTGIASGSLKIRFRGSMDRANEDADVDNIVVTSW